MPGSRLATRTMSLEALGPLRWLGGMMLSVGALLPLGAHSPGLPCPVRSVTGVPCPLCGMTTSVADAMHGHFLAAIGANPFGLVAIGFALGLLARPRWNALRVPLVLVIGAIAVAWVWELHRFGLL